MGRLALVVPVFSRTGSLPFLFRSAERADIDDVYIADSGRMSKQKEQIYSGDHSFDLQVFDLEYDTGIGVCLRTLLERTSEEFLLFLGPNMEVPLNYERLLRVLTARRTLGGVGGLFLQGGRVKTTAGDLHEAAGTVVIDVRGEKQRDDVVGTSLVEVEYIPKAGMYKRKCLTDRRWDEHYRTGWDNVYDIGVEQLDFCVAHMKSTDWTFGVCPEVYFIHHEGSNDEYVSTKMSERKLNQSVLHFQEKWGYDGIENGLGGLGIAPQLAFSTNRDWYRYRYSDVGEEFVDADWDTLVILDGARPDILTDAADFAGAAEVTTRYSPASESRAFMQSQFEGRDLHDTVYVSANPYVADLPDGIFHDVVSVFDAGWDENLRTIPPGPVRATAVEAFETYPDKRFIIHFMQPHYPFIGESGANVSASLPKDDAGGTNPWVLLTFAGTGDREVIRRAYEENHTVVYPHAIDLVEREPGTTVITADHANLVGERGFPVPMQLWGHPSDFPHPALRQVPWIRFGTDRRATSPAPPRERERTDESVVDDRLAALGYK